VSLGGCYSELTCGYLLQELHADIQAQITSCDSIIASKDKLINEIKRELKRKDDEFVKILKQEAEDVDLLLETMADQMNRMSTACRYAPLCALGQAAACPVAVNRCWGACWFSG
jgi:RNA-binding protein YhbY